MVFEVTKYKVSPCDFDGGSNRKCQKDAPESQCFTQSHDHDDRYKWIEIHGLFEDQRLDDITLNEVDQGEGDAGLAEYPDRLVFEPG